MTQAEHAIKQLEGLSILGAAGHNQSGHGERRQKDPSLHGEDS
jgi:hypothetical protein